MGRPKRRAELAVHIVAVRIHEFLTTAIMREQNTGMPEQIPDNIPVYLDADAAHAPASMRLGSPERIGLDGFGKGLVGWSLPKVSI